MAVSARHKTPAARNGGEPFSMPHTVSHAALLDSGSDEAFRRTVYLMVLAFGRLIACRDAFGRAMGDDGPGLTGSQFAVLIGTAYCQGSTGVSIRALAEHVQLASTHVTTEVGRLIRKGLLSKRVNAQDRRGVLVKLTHRGEATLLALAPFLRDVNDLLFQDVRRADFAVLSRFLGVFADNSARALEFIGRTEPGAERRSRPNRQQRDWTHR
jgi:MarR family transcriptional regulator, organic hydroperoxide resistance regulator